MKQISGKWSTDEERGTKAVSHWCNRWCLSEALTYYSLFTGFYSLVFVFTCAFCFICECHCVCVSQTSLFSDFAVALDATQSSKPIGRHSLSLNKEYKMMSVATCSLLRNNLCATEYLCLGERAFSYCFILILFLQRSCSRS